jgi:hypothetical protein
VTIREWLDTRTPVPPQRLRGGIDDVLGDLALRPISDMAAATIEPAAATLRELLARPTAGRESALDLLVVDALVTYVFEAAAAEPDQLVARAEEAMVRFSALA